MLNDNKISDTSLKGDDLLLPPPLRIDIPLEETIMQRMSMRSFADVPVTDEELSTILWSAYGKRDDGELTVPKFNEKLLEKNHDGFYQSVVNVLRSVALLLVPMSVGMILVGESARGWQVPMIQMPIHWFFIRREIIDQLLVHNMKLRFN